MATVNSRTTISIDSLVNGTVVSGTIDAASGHLLLTTRGGAVIDAGLVSKPFGAAWVNATAYVTGDVVGYAGAIWKALANSTGKPPALFNGLWTRLTGVDIATWIERDAYFTGDTLSESWELFWKSGTVTASYSSIAGEFESGIRSLKLTMSASSFQRMYYKEENIVRGGEIITVTVRAKLLSAATGVTVGVELHQNDATSTPTPLATGDVVTSANEAAQTLTTSWATYRFTVTAANAKPRANANVMFTTGANAAVVLVDRIKIVKRKDTLPNVQIFTAGGTWVKPAGAVRVEYEVVGAGGAGGGAGNTGASQNSKGSGGGSGGYAWGQKDADLVGATESVTVGTAGTGVAGADGGAGTGSSFGAHGVVGGGAGGNFSAANGVDFWVVGGAGGTATAGDLLIPGEHGDPGNGDTSLGVGAKGANSRYGAGGIARVSGSVGSALAGSHASGYGAGGGGALNTASIASGLRAGGNGTPGLVIVTTYFQ